MSTTARRLGRRHRPSGLPVGTAGQDRTESREDLCRGVLSVRPAALDLTMLLRSVQSLEAGVCPPSGPFPVYCLSCSHLNLLPPLIKLR